MNYTYKAKKLPFKLSCNTCDGKFKKAGIDIYSFWVYKHNDNYQNDNLIVLPNGETTFDFNDVINCKSAQIKNG